MYVDVTFQLDHNEDYESIEYILLSTAFAHEINPIGSGWNSGYDLAYYPTGEDHNNFIAMSEVCYMFGIKFLFHRNLCRILT